MPYRNIHGILNINKPEGYSSFGVITRLRRLSGERKIGHTGTLDPSASGVLPVLFGQATKISRFLSLREKEYQATIELGTTTDTYDREGKVVSHKTIDNITLEQVNTMLCELQGQIQQVPPIYSAIKYHGKKYCELVRKGHQIIPKPRRVNINKLELVQLALPELTVNIECSSGTYVRSLAYDLGQKLGCGAYLKNLIRTRSGVFRLKDALSMDEIASAFSDGSWQSLFYPLDYPLSDWDKVIIDEKRLKLLKGGNSIQLEGRTSDAERLRAYNSEGLLVAILKFNADTCLWQHDILFTW